MGREGGAKAARRCSLEEVEIGSRGETGGQGDEDRLASPFFRGRRAGFRVVRGLVASCVFTAFATLACWSVERGENRSQDLGVQSVRKEGVSLEFWYIFNMACLWNEGVPSFLLCHLVV